MEDQLKAGRHRLRWARVQSDLPAGIHRPKLPGDVGWDLECMKDVIIPPMGVVDVPVNARLWLPDDVYADIRNRSSMGRRGLYVEHNLIDTGYRGPIFVLIRNMAMPSGRWGYFNKDGELVQSTYQAIVFAENTPWDTSTVRLRAGERIGQLVFHRHTPVWLSEVEEIPLDSERAEAGFGSTGR